MRINWVVPCRYAEMNADGTISITGGGVDTLWVSADAVPGEVALLLAIRLVETNGDLEEPHTLVLRLTRPGDAEADEIARGQLRAEGEVVPRAELDRGFLFVMGARFTVEGFGRHDLHLTLDDDTTWEIPVLLRDAAEFRPGIPAG
jgi:hypothetical protein